MFAYIVHRHGQPLMPCSPRKARLLLKTGKAKVIKMVPFTLQLLYGSSGYKQEVSLGVDAGTKHIGVSATTEKAVPFEAEVHPRTDIQTLLATRRENRRARRSRKTRYRKSRILNRRKPEGWLTPSVKHKVVVHLKTIRQIHHILPVGRTTIEAAQFDLQKLANPEIEGRHYQEGRQLGFWNTREYVLWRDRHTCQWCQGKSKDRVLNVHHIESRKTGGDRPDNLITLCETCHDLIHRTHQERTIPRKSGGLRDATQMGIMRWRIYNETPALFSACPSDLRLSDKAYAHQPQAREVPSDRCSLHQWQRDCTDGWHMVPDQVGAAQQSATAQSHHQERWEAAAQHCT